MAIAAHLIHSKNKKRIPEDAPYLVLSKLVNGQTAFSELLGSEDT